MPQILYALFFVSGFAALIYEVTWVRSLGLVFGASHLAVTIVLSVYMAGLALGSLLFGRRIDAVASPLRLYGWLELGVGAFAVVFLGLLSIYPWAYGPLARLAETNRIWLSVVRVGFAAMAMIVPATLMGGTLPAMSRVAAGRSGPLAHRLALLYGVNTLGAVTGALAAGFVLLRAFGVTSTILGAAAANIAVGVAAIALSKVFQPDAVGPVVEPSTQGPADRSDRLVLWGIGVSGFCALGYEVLWTRMLSLVVGTSVYS